MGGAVDLHSHTTASDGTLRPRELVRLAARHGVRVLAVTDHDSTEGLHEAMDEARKLPPLEIVPGLEINCDVPGAEIHVLGYCLDWEAEWFQEFLGAQREERLGALLARAAAGQPEDEAKRALLELALLAPDDPRLAELLRERAVRARAAAAR